jgi:tRNA G18 (ribose-2'-O)-methylase SpoU
MSRGYFGTAIYQPRREENVGGLWRTAACYEAAFVATVGGTRYQKQSTDTPDTARHVPLLHYAGMEELAMRLPWGCALVAVEMTEDAVPLDRYIHRERALYLLGSETGGLPASVLARCHDVIQIPTPREFSLNVATAGSIVLAHRYMTRSSRRRGDLVPMEVPAN